MRINPQQLTERLTQVAPVYLISGDEPLIVSESAALIRDRVLQSGNVERFRFHYDQELNWETIVSQAQELSLFSPLKLIEIEFSALPDKQAANRLTELLQQLNSDTCLLLMMPPLKKNQQKQAWFQQIDQRGIIISVLLPQGQQLTQWVKQRLRRYQLQPETELAQRLIYYYEGNLLALSQTIRQLSLTYPNGTADLADVESSLTESGQFSQYQLVDALWNQQPARAQQIVRQLRQEGEELTLFNWLMDKDLTIISALQQATSPDPIWHQFKVWPKRQNLLQKAAKQLSVQQIQQARYQLAQLDLAIKTQFNRQNELEFEQLLLILSPQQWSYQHG
ncbi:DNA polymerase III subunit delta [Celerinatantimonas sp. YJH-8]|uniref:DNA polymerase III subunit delta n=1 Tax=Celerinatantimonas sp. YJH-8 TaxID=3228714 RepID=UPI0038C457F3